MIVIQRCSWILYIIILTYLYPCVQKRTRKNGSLHKVSFPHPSIHAVLPTLGRKNLHSIPISYHCQPAIMLHSKTLCPLKTDEQWNGNAIQLAPSHYSSLLQQAQMFLTQADACIATSKVLDWTISISKYFSYLKHSNDNSLINVLYCILRRWWDV